MVYTYLKLIFDNRIYDSDCEYVDVELENVYEERRNSDYQCRITIKVWNLLI